MVDCQMYGLNAGDHHLTNVLLHGAAVILLFLALVKITTALTSPLPSPLPSDPPSRHYGAASGSGEGTASERRASFRRGIIWRCAFVAAVFAIHPLRAESVAWVSERKDVLCGVFFMLTLWCYAGYASNELKREKEKGEKNAEESESEAADIVSYILGI